MCQYINIYTNIRNLVLQKKNNSFNLFGATNDPSDIGSNKIFQVGEELKYLCVYVFEVFPGTRT